MGTIVADILLNKSPRTQPVPSEMDGSDAIVFVGPVWMGFAATPLRPYLKYAGAHSIRYVFVSISGGADGSNAKLARDLKKRAGREADALLDLHIADLLPSNPRPERKDTSAYRVTALDIQSLSDKAVKAVEAAFGRR